MSKVNWRTRRCISTFMFVLVFNCKGFNCKEFEKQQRKVFCIFLLLGRSFLQEQSTQACFESMKELFIILHCYYSVDTHLIQHHLFCCSPRKERFSFHLISFSPTVNFVPKHVLCFPKEDQKNYWSFWVISAHHYFAQFHLPGWIRNFKYNL